MICLSVISSEKNATFFRLCGPFGSRLMILRMIFSASAVFPMEGRAARMMRSVG